MTPVTTIKKVEILNRHPRVTEVRVVCVYERYEYAVRTVIESGEGLPEVALEGFTVPPAEEFVVSLHEALGEYAGGELVRAELERINN